MASEEQLSHGDSDFNGFVADDDFTEKKLQVDGDEESPIEELGSRDPLDFDSYEFVEENGSEIYSQWRQSDDEDEEDTYGVEESGSPDLEDSGLYENVPEIDPEQHESDDIKAEAEDDSVYPQCLKRHRDCVVSGEEINEEETSRKRRKFEFEIDVSVADGQDLEEYPIYDLYDEEEDFNLWDVCPFVDESLKSQRHLLPDSEWRHVKQTLSASLVLSDKVIELDKQWSKLHEAKVELDGFKAELIQAQNKLIMQVLGYKY